MPSMPMVDGILSVHERCDRDDGNQHQTMPRKEITNWKPKESFAVELIRVKREHDDHEKEGDQARDHLPLSGSPVGLAFPALDHWADVLECAEYK